MCCKLQCGFSSGVKIHNVISSVHEKKLKLRQMFKLQTLDTGYKKPTMSLRNWVLFGNFACFR